MEIATQKARAYAEAGREALRALQDQEVVPVYLIGEDSGLDVDAFPDLMGVRSKRWHPGTDQDRVQELLRRMAEVQEHLRTGHYTCGMVAITPSGTVVWQHAATCQVHITTQSRGSEGFGYDPITAPMGQVGGAHVTFGMMRPGIKTRFSHRALATTQLAEWLKNHRR